MTRNKGHFKILTLTTLKLVYSTHITATGLSLGPENMTEFLKKLSGRTTDTSNQSTAILIENTLVHKINMMWLEI